MVGVVGSSPIAPTKSMSHSSYGGCRQGPTGNHARGCTGTRGQEGIWRLPCKEAASFKVSPERRKWFGAFSWPAVPSSEHLVPGDPRGEHLLGTRDLTRRAVSAPALLIAQDAFGHRIHGYGEQSRLERVDRDQTEVVIHVCPSTLLPVPDV